MTRPRARRTAGFVVLVIGLVSGLIALGSGAGAHPPPLGLAEPFAVLAGATVTNVGPTTIIGNLGVSPGTAVTGNPDVQGEIHTGPLSPAAAAQIGARGAYVHLFNEPCPGANDLTGTDLGGLTLKPGVYCFSSTAQLTGTLTLDFENNPNALFVFKIGTQLTTASGSVVEVINTGGETNPCNVYWQVGSSAVLGTGSSFLGTIIANQSITASSATNVLGRLFALIGQVSLDNTTVTKPPCGPAPPPPATTTTVGPTTTIVTPTTTIVTTTTTTVVAPTTTTAAPTTTTTPTIPPITFPPITFPPFLGIPPIILPPIPFPLFGFPPFPVPPITLPTTTTTVGGATTTTVGGTTTTTSAGATTTTAAPGGTTTTSTALPGGTTTATTSAPATTTTTPASGTTTTDRVSSGATTTVGPGANTTSPAPLFSPAVPALRVQDLPRTGQGASGPLSLAVVSILLGAMLLLTPRRGAVALPSGAGYAPVGLERRQPLASTGIKVQPAAIGQVATRAPESFDVLEDLERLLQAADARMAARRAMHRQG